MSKKVLAVFFGGKTAEHDVSIITGLQAMENADASKYDILPIYIDRHGRWHTGDLLRDMSFLQKFDETKVKRVYVAPAEKQGGLMMLQKSLGGHKVSFMKVDAALLCMHGMNGEDGALQGALEMADIPYSSAGVLGSAVGMDKIAMKWVFQSLGFPILPFVWFSRSAWQKNADEILQNIKDKLNFPLFVKPSNLGSSIGISKAKDEEGLRNAIEVAVRFDHRILVEAGIEKPKEINCAVLGMGDEITPSVCEQPVNWEEFLTFDEKYCRGQKSKGMQSLQRKIPADISTEMTQSIQQMAGEAFRALDCKGVVRIDFMIDEKNNACYINEINTIPGSLAFYLWEAVGISFAQLIDKLVDAAQLGYQQKQQNVFAHDSKILEKYAGGTKGVKR